MDNEEPLLINTGLISYFDGPVLIVDLDDGGKITFPLNKHWFKFKVGNSVKIYNIVNDINPDCDHIITIEGRNHILILFIEEYEEGFEILSIEEVIKLKS